jgi:hypothetical protein
MSTAFLLLLIVAAVLVAGFFKTVAGMIQAPEGYEDENGFHQFVDADGASGDDRGFLRGLGNAKTM